MRPDAHTGGEGGAWGEEPQFSLDAQGQLTARRSSDASLLEGREGSWALWPTGPDQLLFVRTPVDGRPGLPGRVVLSGDLSGFPLADLMAFLAQARFSGTLRVITPAGQRLAVMDEGELRGARSDEPRDALADVIVRLGHATQAQVDAALKATTPDRVGRLLVEQGVLEPHELFACMSHQVSGIFEAIMLSREGTFLVTDVQELEGAQAIKLSMQSLLMDTIRKVDELNHYRRRIPHGRLFVTPLVDPGNEVEPEARALWERADGSLRLIELARALHLSEFDATALAHRLLSRGALRLSEGPHGAQETVGSGPTPIPSGAWASDREGPPDAAAVVAIFNAIFAEAFSEVTRHGRIGDFLETVNAALAHQAQADGSAFLRGLTFSPQGTLPEEALLKAWEEQGGKEDAASLARLRRNLSDVMFFLLFQTGELLESQADEQLAHRVRALLGKLGT
ncbi:MAG TPA: DUF4388 domain-containing protein [Myxococcaceae bacterium]|nr:DUF4388 domain-containing protein [Myxococcaceae bacterium]